MRLLANRPQFRFLLRACGLLIGMLLVWWIFLLDPLLGWMRFTGEYAVSWLPGAPDDTNITVKPDGNWMVQVPAPAAAETQEDVQRIAGTGAPVARPKRVRSFKIEVSRDKLAQFTVALPLFWALMLTVTGKGWWRAVAYGTAAIALMVPFAMTLHTLAMVRSYFHIQSTTLSGFLWHAAGYMDNEVLPYATPFFVAIGLNRHLRSQIFALALPAETVPQIPSPRREKKRRRREAKIS